MDALRLADVIGSTRPGRRGPTIARRVHDRTARCHAVDAGILGLTGHDRTVLDEPVPAAFGPNAPIRVRHGVAEAGAFAPWSVAGRAEEPGELPDQVVRWGAALRTVRVAA